MDKKQVIVKDVEPENKFKICQVCGCRQYVNNYARHMRSKRHQQVDYVNNTRFEIIKITPRDNQNREIIMKT